MYVPYIKIKYQQQLKLPYNFLGNNKLESLLTQMFFAWWKLLLCCFLSHFQFHLISLAQLLVIPALIIVYLLLILLVVCTKWQTAVFWVRATTTRRIPQHCTSHAEIHNAKRPCGITYKHYSCIAYLYHVLLLIFIILIKLAEILCIQRKQLK